MDEENRIPHGDGPLEGLRPEDLPDPMDGWGDAAAAFAVRCDDLGARNPSALFDLEIGFVLPLVDAVQLAGRVPSAYTLDDLRMVIVWLARTRAHGDWGPGGGAPYLRIHAAVVDRMRSLLVERLGDKRPTELGADHPCPWCGSRSVARIAYGYPTDLGSMQDDLAQGRVALGGCVIRGDDARLACTACGHRFRQGWRPGIPLPFERARMHAERLSAVR